jgi:hypothetical protein
MRVSYHPAVQYLLDLMVIQVTTTIKRSEWLFTRLARTLSQAAAQWTLTAIFTMILLIPHIPLRI